MHALARIAAAERTTRAMLAAGIAAPVVAWALSVAAAVAWSGYDPVAQSISVLARGPAGWLLTVAFATSGLLGVPWAIAVHRVVGVTGRERRLVLGVLLMQAALVLLFAVFPTDLERGRTPIGVLHLVVFGLYALETPVALAVVARVMRRDPRWAGWPGRTMWAARVVTLGLLLAPVTLYGPLLPWLGLLERAFVAVPTAWQVAVSVAALRRLSSGVAARPGAGGSARLASPSSAGGPSPGRGPSGPGGPR